MTCSMTSDSMPGAVFSSSGGSYLVQSTPSSSPSLSSCFSSSSGLPSSVMSGSAIALSDDGATACSFSLPFHSGAATTPSSCWDSGSHDVGLEDLSRVFSVTTSSGVGKCSGSETTRRNMGGGNCVVIILLAAIVGLKRAQGKSTGPTCLPKCEEKAL